MVNKLEQDVLADIYKGFSCSHSDRIVSILSMYREGEYIYTDVLRRNLKCTYQEAEMVLDALADAGLARRCFQYICPVCNRFTGPFRTEDEKDDVFCDCCDSEINKQLKNTAYLICSSSSN